MHIQTVNCIQHVRSGCAVLIMRSAVVIITVQSVPDCAVVRTAFSVVSA